MGAAAAAIVAPVRCSAILRALRSGRTPVSRWLVPVTAAATAATAGLAALSVLVER